MFTATEGPNDMPLVVLEYSVGVVLFRRSHRDAQSTQDKN